MASSISAGNATNGVIVSSDNTGALNLITGSGSGTTAVSIDSSQNVGVGTITPSSYGNGLVVYNSGTGVVRAYGNTVGTYMYASSGGSVGAVGTETNHAFTFNTNNTERARIDTSGNLLVGTTSAVGALAVKQSGAATYSNGISLIDSGSTNRWGLIFDGGTTRLYFGYNAVSKSYIDPTTGAYIAVSDSRLKENVTPLSLGLSEILRLNPVTYNFKSDEKKSNQVGLIAQEVLPIIPEAVGVPANYIEGSYGLNYAGLVPVLIKAIQELKAELDALKAKVGE